MKKNDTRNRIFDRYASTAVRGGVLVCFSSQVALTPLIAFADVGLPPPAVHQTTNNGFPSSQALKNQGYDPSTGVLRVDERNRGTSTVTKTGDTITGQQQKTVTATGNYGEKGTMQTSVTQKVNIGRVETALGATLATVTAAGGAIGSDYAADTYKDLQNGDYLSATRNAIGAVLTGLSKLDITGFGSGINDFLDKTGLRGSGSSSSPTSPSKQAEQLEQLSKKLEEQQRQSERNGDLRGSISQEVAKKAVIAAQKEAQKQDMHEDVVWVAGAYQGHPKYGMTPEQACSGDVPGMAGLTFLYTSSGSCIATDGKNKWLWGVFKQVYKYKPSETFIQDATLNSNDVQKILERMLQSQQTNHKELMEQLAKIGDIVEQSTTSKEFTPSVSYSEPYTPAGSDTPQQTRFEIDKNGNITTSTVSRPDLKPNSSQAPTRSVVIPNKSETGQQTGQKETGENTTPTTGETGQQTPTTAQTSQQN